MKKKSFLLIIIAICISLILGAIFFLHSNFLDEDHKVMSRLTDHAELISNYEKIKELNVKLKSNPQDEVGYLVSIAFEWKSLGDLTQDAYFYEKALELYEQGAQKYGAGNIAFYWNAGKVAEALKRYDVAEFNYREAIRIAPTYFESHQNLADLYEYKLEKKIPDVIQVYAEGLKATTNSAQLFLNQCGFLRRQKDFTKAIECYEVLVEAYPDNQGFKNTVQELKNELKNQ